MRWIPSGNTTQKSPTYSLFPTREQIIESLHQGNQGEPVPGLDVKMGHNPGGQGIIVSTNSTTSILLSTQNIIR